MAAARRVSAASASAKAVWEDEPGGNGVAQAVQAGIERETVPPAERLRCDSARRSDAAHGQRYLRFAFCRSLGVLRAAGERLAAMEWLPGGDGVVV